jgi:hypothetical protein
MFLLVQDERKGAGRTSLYLLDYFLSRSSIYFNPFSSQGVENSGQLSEAKGGMCAKVRLPNDRDCIIGIIYPDLFVAALLKRFGKTVFISMQ